MVVCSTYTSAADCEDDYASDDGAGGNGGNHGDDGYDHR